MIFFSQSAGQNATKEVQANIVYTCKPVIYMNLHDAFTTTWQDGEHFYTDSEEPYDIEVFRKRRVDIIANLARLFILNGLKGFKYETTDDSFDDVKGKMSIYDQYLMCDKTFGDNQAAFKKGITLGEDHKKSKIAFKGASTNYWTTHDPKTGGKGPNHLRLASTMFHEILHGYYERAIKHCKLDIYDSDTFPPGFYTIGGDDEGHVEPKDDNHKIITNILNSRSERPDVPTDTSLTRLDQPLSSIGYNTLLEHTFKIIDNFLKGCKKDD